MRNNHGLWVIETQGKGLRIRVILYYEKRTRDTAGGLDGGYKEGRVDVVTIRTREEEEGRN